LARTITLAFISLALVAGVILQSNAAFQASLQGLTIWWNIVFPGLLPYLVLFELITAFGLTHAIGALIHPATSRLLKLPGESAVVLVLGWLGGQPLGAEAAARLRKQELITKSQGQRLLALAHMPNPMFMLIVIGSGFLHKPAIGVMIAAAVWLSAIWLLVVLSLFSSDPHAAKRSKEPRASLLRQAAYAMHAARLQDGRSFGKVLGDAVAAGVQKLLTIGGFILFAAVLAKLFELLLAPILANLELPFISQALFESHLGAYAVSLWQTPGSNGLLNAAAIAAALAWSGLSGILQVSHAINGTDLKLQPFIAARLLHSLHAFCFIYLLWKPINALLPSTFPAFYISGDEGRAAPAVIKAADLPSFWGYSLTGSLMLMLPALFLAFILLLYRRKAVRI